MSVTLAIIIFTAIVSFTAFSNEKIKEDLIFYPPAIDKRNQWYRFITCGLIHADFLHLLFNMWALYSFGQIVETFFGAPELFGSAGKAFYVILYVGALVASLLPTYFKNRDNYYYRSLGASGAVSAIVFAGILLYPLGKITMFPIPFPLPAFIFGVLYLGVSAYLSRRGSDNINHSAHFWGAIFGIAFVIVTCNVFTHYLPLQTFIDSVKSYFNL